ncbi:hypothetical protein [Neptuniibacter sp. QD37_11]|uniref:hypothetical protein n=1 Tax=Neptuniibacter sp. QD37_11 TaxID=3398209 RepID=UPI0039F633FD
MDMSYEMEDSKNGEGIAVVVTSPSHPEKTGPGPYKTWGQELVENEPNEHIKALYKKTHTIAFHPHCPCPFQIRIMGIGKGKIDGLPFDDTNDIMGYGRTMEEAARNVMLAYAEAEKRYAANFRKVSRGKAMRYRPFGMHPTTIRAAVAAAIHGQMPQFTSPPIDVLCSHVEYDWRDRRERGITICEAPGMGKTRMYSRHMAEKVTVIDVPGMGLGLSGILKSDISNKGKIRDGMRYLNAVHHETY